MSEPLRDPRLQEAGRSITFDAARKEDVDQTWSHANTLNNTPRVSPSGSRTSSEERHKVGGGNNGSRISFNLKGATFDQTTQYLDQELDIEWMGIVIVVTSFASGMTDAVAFNSWNCFVGMQTGNSVFAALGIGGQPAAAHREQYYKSLLAIGSFCLGTLFFNYIHRLHTGIAQQSTARRRWIFGLSFFIQAMLIIIAAILVQLGVVSNRPFRVGEFSSGSPRNGNNDGSPRYVDLAPIAILSFGAAGQVCLSRVLMVMELPTTVLSTLYHDFTADLYSTRQMWKKSTSIKDFLFVHYRRQNKRLFSIIALFTGALVGGEMYKSSAGMAGALWLAAGLKFAISLAFMMWRTDRAANSVLPR